MENATRVSQILNKFQPEHIQHEIDVSDVDINRAFGDMKLMSAMETVPTEMEIRIKELDLDTAMKMQEEKQLKTRISEYDADILALRTELIELERDDEEYKKQQALLNGAVTYTNKDALIEENNRQKISSNSVEDKMGFRLKVIHDEANDAIWTGKFFFDPGNMSQNNGDNHFVSIRFNDVANTFTLMDMQPRPLRFPEMEARLEHTKDITGFLYASSQYFARMVNH